MANEPDRFMIKIGMDYTPEGSDTPVRAEPGEIKTDIPRRSIGWLRKRGYIEEPEAKTPSAQVNQERASEIEEAHDEAGRDLRREAREGREDNEPLVAEAPEETALESLQEADNEEGDE